MNAVSLIGSGNVAWHLAHVLYKNGLSIEWIWSRDVLHAASLAGEVKARSTSILADLRQSTGCILVCVPDHAIRNLVLEAEEAGLTEHLICHTSGATPLKSFPASFQRCGVFYPLQTLTRGHTVDFKHLPILITSDDVHTEAEMSDLACRISDRVERVRDVERRQIHLSAVMVNNFVYHLCDRAFGQVEAQGLDASLLYPLLEETIRKIKVYRHDRVQTGPAIRHDLDTLYAHLSLLADEPELAALYRQLSKSINPELQL